MKWYDRRGNESSPKEILQDAIENQRERKSLRLFNVPDVIDLILLSADPRAISIEPKRLSNDRPLFGKTMEEKIGRGGSSHTFNDFAWCRQSTKFNHGIDTHSFDRDEVTKLNSMIQPSRNGWTDPKGLAPVNGRSAIWFEIQRNHPLDANPRLDKDREEDMDHKNIMKNANSSTRCTEFSVLYGDVASMSIIMKHGYKLFTPKDLKHRWNWLKYKSNSNGRDSQMMMFYLDARSALEQLRVLDQNKMDSRVKMMITNGSINSLHMGNLWGICNSNPKGTHIPHSILEQGTYYMGTSISCPKTRYRLLIQPDGNIVIYDMQEDKATWSTNTFSAMYVHPIVEFKRNGEFFILDRFKKNKRVFFAGTTTSNNCYLTITDSGNLHIRDAQTIFWSSRSSSPVITNYFDNDLFALRYEKVYSLGHTIFSPNLLFRLHFQEKDGNFVLQNTITRENIWSTGSQNKNAKTITVQKDGNVVIRSNTGTTLWNTQTFNLKREVNLVIDNTGVVLLISRSKAGEPWHLSWSNRSNWLNTTAGGGRDFSERNPRLTSAANIITIAQLPTPYNSHSGCSRFFTGSASGIAAADLRERLNYCKTGYNAILDKQVCDIFSSGTRVLGDDNNSSMKRDMDSYISNNICNVGFEQRFPNNKPIQDILNNFCSCIRDVVSERRVDDRTVSPICYSASCQTDGYKPFHALSTRENNTCPKCMCSNNISMDGIVRATNIQQSCPANCFDISQGRVVDGTSTKKTNTNTSTDNGKTEQQQIIEDIIALNNRTPASTPPASTPPASTPPASTPPASTPPMSTPPMSTPPMSTAPQTSSGEQNGGSSQSNTSTDGTGQNAERGVEIDDNGETIKKQADEDGNLSMKHTSSQNPNEDTSSSVWNILGVIISLIFVIIAGWLIVKKIIKSKPMNQQGFMPPMNQQGFMPPMNQQGFMPPMNQQGFTQPMNQQGFTQPMNQQGFTPPMNQQGFTQPMNQQGFMPPMNQQGFMPTNGLV